MQPAPMQAARRQRLLNKLAAPSPTVGITPVPGLVPPALGMAGEAGSASTSVSPPPAFAPLRVARGGVLGQMAHQAGLPQAPSSVLANQSRLIGAGMAAGKLDMGAIRENAYSNVGGLEGVRRTAQQYGNTQATNTNLRRTLPVGEVANFHAPNGIRAAGLYESRTGRMTLDKGLSVKQRDDTVMHEGTHNADMGVVGKPMQQWQKPNWPMRAPPPAPPAPPPSPFAGLSAAVASTQPAVLTAAQRQAANPSAFNQEYYSTQPRESRAEIWGPMKRRMAADGVLARTPGEVPGVIQQFDKKYPNFFTDPDVKKVWNNAKNPTTAPANANPALQYLQTVKAQPPGAPALQRPPTQPWQANMQGRAPLGTA